MPLSQPYGVPYGIFIDFLEGGYMKENTTSANAITEVKEFLDNIGTIQTAKDIIVPIVLLVLFLLSVIVFRKNINKVTRGQIQKFEKEGKYLPSIYVELNSTMEYLRYFVFSHRWRYRIIKQYNRLFEGYEGKRLKKIVNQHVPHKLSPFSTLSTIMHTLDMLHASLSDIRNNSKAYYEKYGQIAWAISNSTYSHIYLVEHLKELCVMVKEKNIVLVGSAGNGKTNSICRLSEIIMANKMPCLLINARDIHENCFEYILKRLPLNKSLQKGSELYLHLVSIILALQGKYFYILIDAINENDRMEFIDSIGDLCDSFAKYSRVRLLFTCRSEYFDSRYNIYFSQSNIKPYVFNAARVEYDERATLKMIHAYMDYYGVRGPFSLEMQDKLMNSLLLTRIFFEVNSNRSECLLEFRNAEIYKLYFEKIVNKNTEIDLNVFINRIAQIMFDDFKFDRVFMEKLQLTVPETNSLRQILDNNLIISHSIHSGSGITEREDEYVYFVFDELRDFCLARYILTDAERNSDSHYALFFEKTDLLFAQRLSPTEGIVKYAYHHFKAEQRDDLCLAILNKYGEADIQEISDHNNHRLSDRRQFQNFGIALVFSEGDRISGFELNYIFSCIKKDCRNFWDIFWFLIQNEYGGFRPNIELAVEILLHWENYETIEKILSHFFNDRFRQYTYYQDKSRKIDDLKEWINHIAKKRGTLSDSLKMFLVILAAYEPTEYPLYQYHEFVLSKKIYKSLENKVRCTEVKELIEELKHKVESRINDLDAIKAFVTTIEMGEFDGK